MPALKGQKKKENIKFIIDPGKNKMASRLAEWCLNGATACGIPEDENQSKVMFPKAIADKTVAQMAVLAARPRWGTNYVMWWPFVVPPPAPYASSAQILLGRKQQRHGFTLLAKLHVRPENFNFPIISN